MSDLLQGVLLDEFTLLTRTDLCGHGRLAPEELEVLAALGLVTPQDADRYPATMLARVRRAVRLKKGLETDWETVALIMDLLQEIEALRARIRHLQAHEVAASRTPREPS